METGKRKNPKTGELMPAHFIQTVVLRHNEKILSECQMGFGISKNPFFSFQIKSTELGDKVSISWVDNLGNSDNQEHIIS